MIAIEELKQKAKAGDRQALQALRDRGFFAQSKAPGYPVSHAQRRLWIVDEMIDGFGAYNLPAALRLRGALDPAALRAAFQAIVRRHESLRTTFAMIDGDLRQIVHDDMAVQWEYHDLSGDADREVRARRVALEHASRPFDLARGPLVRVALVHLATTEHLLLFNLHHIVGDLASLSVLVQELSICYDACVSGRQPSLAPLPVQYRHFTDWQSRLLAGPDAARHRAYWLDKLAGPLPVLDLPTDYPRPPLKTYGGNVCRAVIPSYLTMRLRNLGLRHGSTLFMVLMACVKVVLYRHTGQEDIIVGFPASGRDHADFAGQIGCYVNALALRDRLAADVPFTSLIGCIRQAMLEAYEHQAYPFDRLVEELNLPRDMSRSPVFDVSVSLAHADEGRLRLGDVDVAAFEDGFAAAKLDMSFDFYEAGDGIELALAYNTDLFAPERVARMAAHYVRVATCAVEDPQQTVGRMAIMSPEEEHRVLVEFNRSDRPLALNETVVDQIERQAALSPDAAAVKCGAQVLSYGELNSRANVVARLLRQSGVGTETLVGLFAEPSLDVVCGLLGILKAGGIYLPLDPINPMDRLAAMLDDVQPPVVLTQSALESRLPVTGICRVLLFEDVDAARGTGAAGNPVRMADPDNAAYAIFTSGSTGRAKATVLLHRGLHNVAVEQARMFAPGPGDRVLQFAALGFDASVFEMIMALCHGATLCLADREQMLPGTALLTTLEREEISIVTLPPSSLAALPDADLPKLRTIAVAGEACPAEVVRRWARGREFFNLYGPTEATIWASAARCTPDGELSIGRPIANTRLYVLDRCQRPVPWGVHGELCIAGVGVGRSYWNRPELTAARFIPDSFDQVPGGRMYRTGDLARHRSDGTLEFLGRIDTQVKLRGYRIELGEIEAALAQHHGVRDVVVLAGDSEPGPRRIVAYVTSRDDADPLDADALRQFLRNKLPDYMVPSGFAVVGEMPLTANKKIDRKALAAMDVPRPDLAHRMIAPRDDLEWVLAGFFADLLRLDQIGVESNFFELGGDSLLATRLVSRLRETLRADISIPRLFRAGTLGALAALVREAAPAGQADKIAAAYRRLQAMSPAEKQELVSQHAGSGSAVS